MLALIISISFLHATVESYACLPEGAAREAYNESNLEAAYRAVEQARSDPGCSAHQSDMVGRLASLLSMRAAYQESDRELRVNALRSALDLGRPWQLLSALGYEQQNAGRFEAAVDYYDQALMDLSDSALTPDWLAPSENDIDRIQILKEEAELALGELPRSRSGCVASFRGFSVTRRTLPVEYRYGSLQMTERGQSSADELYRCLVGRDMPPVLLTGHADPTGDRAFNCSLSYHRAEALGAYLRARGYVGEISVDGAGEEEPFTPQSGYDYSREQLLQMSRRVVVDIGSSSVGSDRNAPSCATR
jgi:outer membrane protein OmpA-like peptidoglycan-associated protein